MVIDTQYSLRRNGRVRRGVGFDSLSVLLDGDAVVAVLINEVKHGRTPEAGSFTALGVKHMDTFVRNLAVAGGRAGRAGALTSTQRQSVLDDLDLGAFEIRLLGSDSTRIGKAAVRRVEDAHDVAGPWLPSLSRDVLPTE